MKTRIDSLTEQVIGAAMAVYRTLGPGFLKSAYRKVLAGEGILLGRVNHLNATGVAGGLLVNFGAPNPEACRKSKNPKNLVNVVGPIKSFAASNSAFTLLELMVAMAVMSILLVLLLNMVDSGTKLWRVNENRVDSYREARAALGIISRDLQNALASNPNQFLWNASAFPNLASVGNLVSDTNQGAAMFFLSALPAKAQDTASNKSDVCQVGYFMAFGTSSSASNSPVNTMNIYRYILSSDETFKALQAAAGGSPFTSNLSTSTDSKVELLARNITRFTARAYTFTNNSLAMFSASADTPVPDLVEVSITAINQEAGKKLGNSSSDISKWTATNSPAYTKIAAPVEQTFTTRIKLNRPQ